MFLDYFNQHDFLTSVSIVKSKSRQDVEFSLSRVVQGKKLEFTDYLSLISPAADFYLEEMAILSKEITEERFGKTILMYMPMYLSNECRSSCLYCGFSFRKYCKSDR